jgi:hypothetical protein
VCLDQNSNGIVNLSEPPKANVTVALYPQINSSALLTVKISDIEGTAEVIQVIKRFMNTGLSAKSEAKWKQGS